VLLLEYKLVRTITQILAHLKQVWWA